MQKVSSIATKQFPIISLDNDNIAEFCPPSTQEITIVVVHADSVNGLGDNVIILDGLLAISRIYRMRLVVFARNVLQELLCGLDFVDEFCTIEGELASTINRDRINAYKPTYLLSLSCKTWQLRFFSSTNARTIITRTKLANIFHPRFSSVLLLDSSITHRETFLLLARKIDQKHFDRHIDSIDFVESSVKVSDDDKSSIANFLAVELKRFNRDDFNRNASLSEKIAFTKAHRAKVHDTNPLALSLSSSKTPLFLVCINPFNVIASHTLHLDSYLAMVDAIASIPHCVPCICTYGDAHTRLLQAIQDYNFARSYILQDRCIIYHNREGLHTLAAFLEQMSCIITPSTGALHLAENLFVPSIALVSRIDTRRWGSQDKRYVLIPKPLLEITKSQESTIIESTLIELKSLLSI